jgi:YVTN family beta-propeller protein
VTLRPGLLAAIAALFIAAGAGWAQYVEDSIDVGGARVGSLAYNSREDVLYGRCQQAGIFFAISCDSNKVINSFALGRPRQMTYDSVDNKAYCPYEGTDGESLAVIDGQMHTLVKKIEMPGATTPVWDPVSDRVYISCQSTNKVAVVDCATDSLLTYISVGACPLKMYINTLRRKLYVLNYDNGTVSIVNMQTNQVIKSLFVGGTPNAGYYSPSVDEFYSAGAYGYCTVIDGAADSIVARIQLPGTNADIRGATGNENAGMVYLATDLAYVATVRTQDDSLLATSAIGGEPWGITCFDKSGLAYCASGRNDAVYVISTDGEQVLTALPVGDYPYVFAVAPQHDRLYVGHLGGRYVYVLRDTSTGIADRQSPSPRGGDLRAHSVRV